MRGYYGTVVIDDSEAGGSAPGAWATHIAHTPALALQSMSSPPRAGAQSSPIEHWLKMVASPEQPGSAYTLADCQEKLWLDPLDDTAETAPGREKDRPTVAQRIAFWALCASVPASWGAVALWWLA